MIEGSGSVSLTNGSGSGRPKNMDPTDPYLQHWFKSKFSCFFRWLVFAMWTVVYNNELNISCDEQLVVCTWVSCTILVLNSFCLSSYSCSLFQVVCRGNLNWIVCLKIKKLYIFFCRQKVYSIAPSLWSRFEIKYISFPRCLNLGNGVNWG